MKEEASAVAYPVLSCVPQEAGMGFGLWACDTIRASSALAGGDCQLALVVTTQGDTCIPGLPSRAGWLLTNSS